MITLQFLSIYQTILQSVKSCNIIPWVNYELDQNSVHSTYSLSMAYQESNRYTKFYSDHSSARRGSPEYYIVSG